MITFLFTSAGRRVELLNGFRSSMRALGRECRILAVDLEPEWSAACQAADQAWGGRPIDDPGYVKDLVSICERQGVHILIPTLDPELELLAEARGQFHSVGTEVSVCDHSLCSVFSSKRKTAAWFKQNGFRTPGVIADPMSCSGPLFAKRENSSSSIGACRVQGPDHLRLLQEDPMEYVFQPWIEGQEYTVDAYVSREGRLHDAVIRRRVEVRSGEISKGETVEDAGILETVGGVLTSGSTPFYGPVTLQLIRERATGDLWCIEINPRVGGGLPLSLQAGFDLPRYLVEEVTGHPLSAPPRHPAGLRMLRYDAAVFTD